MRYIKSFRLNEANRTWMHDIDSETGNIKLRKPYGMKNKKNEMRNIKTFSQLLEKFDYSDRDALMTELKKKFPQMWMKPGEDFQPGYEGTIWTGEGSLVEHDGEDVEMFNYHVEDNAEKMYVMGVYKPLHQFLVKNGWYAEAHDPGTYFLSRD